MADKSHNVNSRRGTITIVTSDTVTTGTNTQLVNGLGRWVDFTTANMEGSDSTDLIVKNEFGGTVFASGTKAESTQFGIGSVFPMHGTVEIVAVAEGTQSAEVTIPYNIVYDT